MDSFITFTLAIKAQVKECAKSGNMGPIVVHGKTGLGRPATFCTIDMCFEQMLKKKGPHILSTFLDIQKQRHSSLPTEAQFVFTFQVLKELVNYM
uniref:AsIV-cont00155-ORF1 n=1 Tax=Apophua simplicipes ichnovirus TaxID=1329648 RepID=S5DMR1_9VIRU|nr:AsIV-cont00155-ORF1 [Apophua simplicipes ichnovirus]